MFAAQLSVDLARLLLDLLIVLVAAKVAAEAAERLRIPAVLGEITAGVLIGPSVLGLIDLADQRGVSMALLAEIGVLLLLLSVGMEMDLGELGKVGAASIAVAVVGVVVPFAAGSAAATAFGMGGNAAVFFGAALTATSVGITARVFGDLRALATIEARIVLGAAVADDVLGLIILTVVVKVVTGGDVGIRTVAETLGLAVVFLVGTGIVGVFLIPRVFRIIGKFATTGATAVVAGFALMVAFAELADQAKLAFIIGAFMAGLALGRTDQHERIASDLGAVSNLFVPVFFVSIGVNADLEAMAKPTVIGVALVMTVIAVAGKLVAGWAVRGRRADRLLIGMGMIPRGEVGLIFASIGLANGVLDADQYGTLLIVILLTTLMTPPLLRVRLGRTPAAPDVASGAPTPADGWVEARNGETVFRSTPPISATVPVALSTALLAHTAPPADEVLEWFGTHRTAPITWATQDTTMLVDLLRLDEPRAWRFLDASGVLERALPEVARAMERRRADMTDLDPLGSLRFKTVDRLHNSVAHLAPEFSLVSSTEHLALGALVSDVATTDLEREQFALRLAPELEAQRIMAVVTDARVLHRRAHDVGGLDESEMLQLATHLADRTHARDAYLLAQALGDLTFVQRERLDLLYGFIVDALGHPEIVSSTATNLAGARLAAATRLVDDPAAAERLRHTTTVHLLSHEPDVLARQAPPDRAIAHTGDGARGREPRSRGRSVGDRRRLPRHSRPAGPPDPRVRRPRAPDRARRPRDMAGRRCRRQLRGAFRRTTERPHARRRVRIRAEASAGTRRTRRGAVHDPAGRVAMAHRVHGDGNGFTRTAARGGPSVRDRERDGPVGTVVVDGRSGERPLHRERPVRPQARRQHRRTHPAVAVGRHSHTSLSRRHWPAHIGTLRKHLQQMHANATLRKQIGDEREM